MTGARVVDGALERGHDVVAYVRSPKSVVARAKLSVVSGSIEDQAAMRAAFDGAEAVISCLGVRPSFKAMFQATDFQQRTLPKVVAAINDAGVKRFVLMSSFGVGDTRAKASFIPRFILYPLFAGRLFHDKALAEPSLQSCRANWTAVYPVIIRKESDSIACELVPLDEVRKVPGVPVLSFATVAGALVDLAAQDRASNQRLLLTTKGGWRGYSKG